ncbi:MAG: DEAD/DEAH box helicase [Promethearchaeota archaeon]
MKAKEFVTHPLIKPRAIEKRLYQETIIGTAIKWNTLCILPTGLGKTLIAVLAAAYRLKKFPNSKCVFLAPTKPLTLQHQETFQSAMNLSDEDLQLVTGEVPPARRERVWDKVRIAFMTPQVLQNDILAGRYTLKNVSLLVVDEAHRAVGDYAYVFIAQQYYQQAISPLLLALTASPGSEVEKIREVVSNLRIENIELRTRESPDVAPYVPYVKFEWLEVQLPEKFREVGRRLRQAMRSRLQPIKEAGFIETRDLTRVGVRDILGLQRDLQRRIAAEAQPPSHLYQLVSHCAALIRLFHSVELLETQGISALAAYLSDVFSKAKRSGASKAIRELVQDTDFQEARLLTEKLRAGKVEHPKLPVLTRLVHRQFKDDPNSRVIIFSRFRGTAQLIETTLKELSGVLPVRFVGQASKTDDPGLSQKEQAEILQAFRKGGYNVLVATSVGEEGLDIKECNLVIFYEAVASAVRLIQRRGRTGRTQPGQVVVLVAKGTRDQGYYWSAIRKEAQMKELLREMRKISRDVARDRKQATLKDFMTQATPEEPEVSSQSAVVKIVIDSRELRSGIAKSLKSLGAELQAETLDVGDYILSDRVGVEAKTANDFAQSIVDRRLFTQLSALRDTFTIPLLVITGESLYGSGGVSPQSVRGAIASVMIDFRVPIVNVANASEAANLLFAIARREQKERKHTFAIRGGKPSMSTSALQEYIVASLPGVNVTLAKRLLAKFGNVSGVVHASLEELEDIQGIGKTKANAIRKALDSPYVQDTDST